MEPGMLYWASVLKIQSTVNWAAVDFCQASCVEVCEAIKAVLLRARRFISNGSFQKQAN